ncbi:DAB2IP family protein [Megaselia abdita]
MVVEKQNNDTSENELSIKSQRRRSSIFYVPLLTEIEKELEQQSSNPTMSPPPPCGFNWSMTGNDVDFEDDDDYTYPEKKLPPSTPKPENKRYGVLIGSLTLNDSTNTIASNHSNTSNNTTTTNSKFPDYDDSEISRIQDIQTNTSTPIVQMKSRSRNNILSVSNTSSSLSQPKRLTIKEKSSTLPQAGFNASSVSASSTADSNAAASSYFVDVPTNTFPPKNKVTAVVSSPIDQKSSASRKYSSDTSITSTTNMVSPHQTKKPLSFIRRTHSTKVARSNSILKTFSTTKGILSSSSGDNMRANQHADHEVHHLPFELLNKILCSDVCAELLKSYFVKRNFPEQNSLLDGQDSADNLKSMDQKQENTTSRFTLFFSRRSKPLKRTKSVTKLERCNKRDSSILRSSRSHESLLSTHSTMTAIGLMAIAPVHQSVLGKQYCFKVRDDCKEKYYSCESRQERDLWIYCLKRAIDPNIDRVRHNDDGLKLWIYEAKNLPAKKRYFCEIYLDETLYGRTSVKMQTDLLFWGEHFDFPDIPMISFIKVVIFREIERKKKSHKYEFIGSVQIPIREVTSRTFSENWYRISKDGQNSEPSPSSSIKSDVKPATLRIKCRFQSIDILPISLYSEFLRYLKENYKKVCEILEPVIGVKAKEDIGHAMVLLMHAHGQASTYLTDVVVLDLLRVGDQCLTFRGNSLATKSMEAFLKLTGEQYLQETLSQPINQIIDSDKDCEVDPAKSTSSLQRSQHELRNAVQNTWSQIYASAKNFPQQLRSSFATFRERLQTLNREDMADNLISASIFLRFLCPAILSPSLFNITSELPSSRAMRNLTLVAKTLQTLANFTKFQGKEGYMEFLNDFIEDEAPKMKKFLRDISVRPENNILTVDSIVKPDRSLLETAGYIDQGKQLSVLAVLLSENMDKLSEKDQKQLEPLKRILDGINQHKEKSEDTYYPLTDQENLPQFSYIKHLQSGIQLPQPQQAKERGVLTPALDDNRQSKIVYNRSVSHDAYSYYKPKSDLEENILSNSQTSLASSRSRVSNLNHYNNLHHSQSSISSRNDDAMIPTTVLQHPYNVVTADRTSLNSFSTDNSLPYNYKDSYAKNSVGVYDNKESLLHSSTMPRGKGYEERGNFIQVGGDSAFTSKSPTPHIRSPPTNGAHYRGNNVLLSNSLNNLPQPQNRLPANRFFTEPKNSSSNNGHIPMNIEDFDPDLFKYGEKHSASPVHQVEKVKVKEKPHPQRGLVQKSPALAYKNSIYNLQPQSSLSSTASSSSANSATKVQVKTYYGTPPPQMVRTSITPSSSEEHIGRKKVGSDKFQQILSNFKDKDDGNNHKVLSGCNSTSSDTSFNSSRAAIRRQMSADYQNVSQQFQRRLSFESTSSTDTDGHITTSDGKRRRPSLQQSDSYEIQRLQRSLDNLRYKLDQDAAELQGSNDNLIDCGRSNESGSVVTTLSNKSSSSDTQMRGIIERLISMEEDLRREQLKMSLALTYKQRVIEAQGQQIAALDAANNRLLSALTSLRKRYEDQQNDQKQQKY